MPTIEFANPKQCKHWIDQATTPERYDIYITEKNEIIIAPSVSTSNLKTGYCQETSKQVVEATGRQFVDAGYTVFYIKTYYWSSDMTPRSTKEKSSEE